ncbi:protein HAIKU1-like [Lotus japonicus]|uniref:protein HAIKU1-like n=1 Tax=Lotus japonicus TaxID=34305 RepID=UPI0025867CDE|nr:protein HAIKU1-like [Lotus japonicus]
MESSRSKNHNNLGVNRTGQSIRKNHSHEINSDASLRFRRRQHDGLIYHVSKEEFADFVMMNTGLHSHDHPPLLHVQRPPRQENHSPIPSNNNVALQRPSPSIQASSSLLEPVVPRYTMWGNPVESLSSANKRYSENSTTDIGSWDKQAQPQPHPQPYPPIPYRSCNMQPNHPFSSQLPINSWVPMLPSSSSNSHTYPMHVATNPQVPNMNGGFDSHVPTMNNVNTNPVVDNMYFATNPLMPTMSVSSTHPHVATVRVDTYPPVSSMSAAATHPPGANINSVTHPDVPSYVSNPFVPNIPSTESNGHPILPSPTSEFIFPSSPPNFMNQQSPQSCYPPLSPGMQFTYSLTDFPLSPNSQSWITEPLIFPGQFPPSPSEFPPIASPERGDQ